MRARSAAACVGGAMVVIVSCKAAREPQVGQTETTGARILMNDDAAMLLTDARCRRESTCAGKTTDTGAGLEVCRRGLFAEVQAAVSPQVCPAGVDEDSVWRCIAELGRAPCDEERALESLPGCARSELCKAP